MSDILEIKKIIEAQGQAWEEFKRTNDAIIAAKADGKAVGDLEAKLAKVSADMDKFSDLKAEFDAVVAKMQRPAGDSKADADMAAEVKGFNNAMRASFQSQGRAIPAELDAEGYNKVGVFQDAGRRQA